MTNWDFPTAFADHGPEERAAIDRVLASGRLTMGAETEALEAELAAYHGRRHAVVVNSGSSANLLAVAALHHQYDKLRNDPYVIVPAIAWATTYGPLIQHDMRRLLVYDVDDTWNVAPPKTDDYGAVDRGWGDCPVPELLVAVPVLGNPAHLAGWRALADDLGVPLLEDACESIGAWDEGGTEMVGQFGTISTLSFFYSHQISGYEGGAALTDDDDLARTMRLLRNHGNAGWGSEDLEQTYDFQLFGYNLRPSEINAAVARVQLRRLTKMLDRRRANASYFRELTESLPITHPRIEGEPSPFGLPITVESNAQRRRLVAALRASSVDARLPTGGSFTMHPIGAPWRESNPTPNADIIHSTGLFLGCAPWPIPDLIERAVKVMRGVL